MRFLTAFAAIPLFACSAGDPLPQHSVSSDPLGPGSFRVQVKTSINISKSECEALLDEYKSRAGANGQVSVHKPSSKLNGRQLPWCVNNLDGKGVQFNSDLFE